MCLEIGLKELEREIQYITKSPAPISKLVNMLYMQIHADTSIQGMCYKDTCISTHTLLKFLLGGNAIVHSVRKCHPLMIASSLGLSVT